MPREKVVTKTITGKTVRVTGELMARSGMKAIEASAVQVASAHFGHREQPDRSS